MSGTISREAPRRKRSRSSRIRTTKLARTTKVGVVAGGATAVGASNAAEFVGTEGGASSGRRDGGVDGRC